jgi:hypothetical protein
MLNNTGNNTAWSEKEASEADSGITQSLKWSEKEFKITMFTLLRAKVDEEDSIEDLMVIKQRWKL